MKRQELENIQDAAADSALRARQRIEKAIDAGELPLWVMEACTVLERASMLYGVTSAQLKVSVPQVSPAQYDRAMVVH
jgi:hypothetical protein